MKRLILFLLVLMLVISSVSAEEITYTTPEKIGALLTTIQFGSGAVSSQGGEPILASVTQGMPSKLEIVSLNTGKLKSVFELEDCSGLSRTMVTNIYGDIWFSCNQYLFQYIPQTNELKRHKSHGGTSSSSIAEGENGNIYISTYPDAKIRKYDISLESFSTVAELQHQEGKENSNYIYGLNYYDNSLYYIRWTDNNDPLIKRDLTSGTETAFDLPEGVDTIKYGQIKNDYIIFYTEDENGTFGVIAFNLKTELWSQLLDTGVYENRYFTPVIDNKVYYTKSGKYYGIDLNSLEVFSTSIPGWNISGSGNSTVSLTEENFQDKCYANLTFNGEISVINFSNGLRKSISSSVYEPSKSVVNSLNISESGKLYIGEYMGTQAVEYDIYTKAIRRFPASQIGSVAFIDNKAYFGCYPEGSFYVLDSSVKAEPKKLLTLGNEQQRLRNMISADGKIIIGSFPEYAKLGGALTIYDPITNTEDVKRNIIENQSILALTYNNGLVYGGTSISGGLGIDATEENAKVFIFDLNTKEKLLERELIIPESQYPIQSVRGLAVTDAGELVGTADNYVFKLDAETLELKEYKLIGEQAHTDDGQQRWYLSKMCYDEYSGLYYFAEKNQSTLKTLDADTMTITDTGITVSNLYDMGPDRAIYTLIDSELYKIALPEPENNEVKVTINVLGNGSCDQLNVNNVGYGERLNVNIKPDKGYYISSVTYNGFTVLENKSGDYTYLTPPVYKNVELIIEFKEVYWKPEIIIQNKAYSDSQNGCYVFAHIGEFASEYRLTEYGIVFSDTIRALDKEENKYLADGISVSGNFGIQFKGIEYEKNYFAKAYAVYEKDGYEYKVETYPICVRVSEDSLVNFMNSYGYGSANITGFEK